MVNFYHSFVPHAAEIVQPLYQALSGKPRSRTLDWSDELTKAFEDTKEALAKATMLHHLVRGAPTSLTSNPSDTAVGTVLEQRSKGKWKPLAFFSWQLRKPERNYSTFDRELLGIHLAVKHFNYFLEGQQLTIFTDHKPIVAALKKTSEPASGRQARQLAAIAEATSDVRLVEGKNNIVADALSRGEEAQNSDIGSLSNTLSSKTPNSFAPDRCRLSPSSMFFINAVEPGINHRGLAMDQYQDTNVQAYRTVVTNLKLADIQWSDGSFTVLSDTSTGNPRPVIPENWKRKIFNMVHTLAHPGARTTRRMVSSKFVWHGLAKEVSGWAKKCIKCQLSKVQTHIKAPLQKFEAVSKRFQHVHVDLVGPLPESKGHKYLLTVIDRFTRWPEVVPLQDIEAKSVARAYVQNWVARFGGPK